MNTLQQIEQLLLPIFHQLVNLDKKNIPRSFVKLMTSIIPKYKSYSFDTFFEKIRKKFVINSLRKTQIDLIEIGVLDRKEQESLNVLINKFEENLIDEIEQDKELKSQVVRTYEVGQLIGFGGYSYFFRLRGYPNLGLKIRRRGNDLEQKEAFEEELNKVRILMRLGVSVPKYF